MVRPRGFRLRRRDRFTIPSPLQATLVATCLVVTVVAQGLTAAELPQAEPATVGLSADRLERVGEQLDAAIERGDLVGAVSLVARRGQVAHLETHGHLDREAGTAMPADAVFRIASMSKPIVSTGVMLLVEDGKLLLDDPLAKYLPEFTDSEVLVISDGRETRVPAERPIRVYDLLRHMSGLTYGIFQPDTPIGRIYAEVDLWNPENSLAEFARRAASLPLTHQPGTHWDYGISVDIQGALIEKVSGQPLGEFLRQRLFEPLDLRDTGFFVDPEGVDRLVRHYAATPKGLLAAPTFRDFRQPPKAAYGGGGLVSTVRDYARFLQMLLDGGTLDGQRILSRKTVELMTTDHLYDAPGMPPGVGFGLGFAVRRSAGQTTPGSVGTYSWGGIYNTYFWVDPEEELFALLMTQITPFNHRQLSERFRVMVYQAIDD